MLQPATATFDLLVDLATLDFEPLPPNAAIKPPPTNSDWTAMAGSILVYTRLAWATLHKTKAELLAAIGRADPNLAVETTEGIRNAAAFFTAMAEITAEAHRRRLICAATLAD